MGASGPALQVLLVCFAALAAVTAQVTEPGICPFSIPLSDWNEQQFVADPWYEIKAFAVPGLHSMRPGCTQWHFRSSDNGQGLHAQLAYRTGDGDAAVRAFAQYTTSEKHPRFNLTFHDLDGPGNARSVHMKLVATDYNDFALLWGCTEPNLLERKVVSWVLSRRPFLSDNAQEALRGLFSAHDMRPDKLVDTDHDDQTCGAPLHPAVESRADSVFAYGRTAGTLNQDDALGLQPDRPPTSAAQQTISVDAEGDEVRDDTDSVSSNYVGSGWLEEALGAQGVLMASLLALALVSLVASLVAFRVLLGRVQRGTKPVLPVHRQDIVVATLGAGLDFRRFGNVQTRKGVGVGGDPGSA